MKPAQITRRQALGAGITAAAISIVPRHVLGGPGQTPPSEKLNIAGVGIDEQGEMLVEGWGGHSPRLIPEQRMREYKRPPKSLPRSIGHHKEWISACKGNGPARSSFDFAGPLTEAVLLGTLCVRLGGHKLNWDAAELKFTNSDAANALINPPYRKGWSL